MRYYYLNTGANNTIVQLQDTFEEQADMITLTQEEYMQAQQYNKFNPVTRVFSELKPIVIQSDPIEENRLLKEKVAMHEELIFELAMMVYA